MSTNYIPPRKGDNTKAYDKHFLMIELEADDDTPLPSKVEFVTGCIVKPYINPQFPLYVDFDETESAKLNYVNVGYLVTYDDKGRRETAEGSITFKFQNGVICQC
jgi:hypothetical protein